LTGFWRKFPVLVFALASLAATGAVFSAPSPDIRVDQVGYLPDETKYGMVVSASATGAFDVRRVSDDATVFSGTLAAAFTDSASGDSIRTADFSILTTPGNYYLDVAGVGTSYDFEIGLDTFAHAFYMATRAFYGQRCGIAVTMGNVDGTTYSHGVCHASGSCSDLPSTYHSSSGLTGTKSTPKGWHDAGDYGKYIVNSGISTGEVLWTYEFFPDTTGSVTLNIPESGNSTPDILNEARWNLEWMLTMQDADGGVWHKNTSLNFGSFTLPEQDNAGTRYIIGTGTGAPYKTSCSTADFAAVMAIAARLYQPFDAAFSSTCLTAAQNAWTWVYANPNVTYTQPSGVFTGGYNDNNCSDERLWAAAELFRTTGTTMYSDYVVANAGGSTLFSATSNQGWGSLKNLALWTYYFAAGGDAVLKNRIQTDTLTAAGSIASRTNAATNGYRVSLTGYWWGSNGEVANYGLYLLVANRMSPSANFVNAALNNLHYLLGRNTQNLSFVTHVGHNPFLHPHHRPSGSPEYMYSPPWPGMLSGGPNSTGNSSDGVTPNNAYPAKCYIDDTGAYASNEIAINWQAPLVFLLGSTLREPVTPTPTPTEVPCGYPGETCTPTDTPTVTATPTPSHTPTPTPTPNSKTDILFPNPWDGSVPLSFYHDLDGDSDGVRLKFYSVAFRKVYEKGWLDATVGQHVYTLERDEVKNLSHGLYYLVLIDEKGGKEVGRKIMKLLLGPHSKLE
jgi:endoglucanase